jgi:hypothetical protein
MNARFHALVAALALLAGCRVPNDASVRIYGMCYPPAPTATGLCSYPSACGSLLLGEVEADVASNSLDGPLIWPVQVDNQRATTENTSGARDTAIAWIEGYSIHYTFKGVAAVRNIPDVKVGISRSPVLPGGKSVVLAPVIPASVGTVLNGLMTDTDQLDFQAELKAFGHYGDGAAFETGPFQIIGKLGRNSFPPPVNAADGSGSPVCQGLDPTKPVYVASCPQERQTSVIACAPKAAN